MASGPAGKVLHRLRAAALVPAASGPGDGPLLEQFVARRDEAAFAALLRRHGPMILGVCRRVLRHEQDAEDAFQATFLVLARRAAAVVPPQMVGNWLYGVAHQTAVKARATTAKRRARERQVMQMPDPAVADPDFWPELQPLLDRELSRLPDMYRVAMVLCDLEGKTRKEAARQLGVPEGTLAARVPSGTPSCRDASLRVLPSRSHRTMTTRYLSGRRLSSLSSRGWRSCHRSCSPTAGWGISITCLSRSFLRAASARAFNAVRCATP